MSFPALAGGDLDPTRDASHAYAGLMGDWLKQCRPRQKHRWHASLRPSLRGLTTGVVDGNVAFELELNLADSVLEVRTSSGATVSEPLQGQSALIVSDAVARFLANAYWHTETFTGAVLPYARLCERADPAMQLSTLWRQNLNAGQTHLRKASS